MKWGSATATSVVLLNLTGPLARLNQWINSGISRLLPALILWRSRGMLGFSNRWWGGVIGLRNPTGSMEDEESQQFPFCFHSECWMGDIHSFIHSFNFDWFFCDCCLIFLGTERRIGCASGTSTSFQWQWHAIGRRYQKPVEIEYEMTSDFLLFSCRPFPFGCLWIDDVELNDFSVSFGPFSMAFWKMFSIDENSTGSRFNGGRWIRFGPFFGVFERDFKWTVSNWCFGRLEIG